MALEFSYSRTTTKGPLILECSLFFDYCTAHVYGVFLPVSESVMPSYNPLHSIYIYIYVPVYTKIYVPTPSDTKTMRINGGAHPVI
jgi:hypothetical protein